MWMHEKHVPHLNTNRPHINFKLKLHKGNPKASESIINIQINDSEI